MSHSDLTSVEADRLTALMDAQFPTVGSLAFAREAAPTTPEPSAASTVKAFDWSDITATRLDTADPKNATLLGLSTSQHKWIALPAGVDVPAHLRHDAAPSSQTEAARRAVASMREFMDPAVAPEQAALSEAEFVANLDRVFPLR